MSWPENGDVVDVLGEVSLGVGLVEVSAEEDVVLPLTSPVASRLDDAAASRSAKPNTFAWREARRRLTRVGHHRHSSRLP